MKKFEVKAKKHLGQHFLNDPVAAQQIVNALLSQQPKNVLEIGPGTGVLTDILLEHEDIDLKCVEMDQESVAYLTAKHKSLVDRIIFGDFLKLDLSQLFTHQMAIIGNFPYNISTQIVFKVLENKRDVPLLVGMFQKEVAERIASKPGSKVYGITSVLVQAYYHVELLFSIGPESFVPPPKVESSVIRITLRSESEFPDCDEKKLRMVVKQAFNQRRKTLRNSLKSIAGNTDFSFSQKRPEQLSVDDFVLITKELLG